MPLTRALSARLRSGARRQPAPTTLENQDEDVTALKSQAQSAAKLDVEACRHLVASALGQLHVQNSSKSSSSYSTSSASTPCTPSRPRYSRGTCRISSRSSTSSRRSILGSSEYGDSSDDENDRHGHPPRLGGCSSFTAAADMRDDSNKENVAPLRCASQDVLESEARDAQQENAIRRTTRSRRSSLMERQTFTSPSTHLRRLSRSSTTSDLSATSGKSPIW